MRKRERWTACICLYIKCLSFRLSLCFCFCSDTVYSDLSGQIHMCLILHYCTCMGVAVQGNIFIVIKQESFGSSACVSASPSVHYVHEISGFF